MEASARRRRPVRRRAFGKAMPRPARRAEAGSGVAMWPRCGGGVRIGGVRWGWGGNKQGQLPDNLPTPTSHTYTTTTTQINATTTTITWVVHLAEHRLAAAAGHEEGALGGEVQCCSGSAAP